MPQRAAIIDLGSNTTRLVIYEYEPGKWFNLIDEVREVVRLREGMGNTNVLRGAAIERSLNALRMFHTLCNVVGVEDVTAVTTSAVRDAENRDSFLARAEADTGWKLRILSGEEEGYSVWRSACFLTPPDMFSIRSTRPVTGLSTCPFPITIRPYPSAVLSRKPGIISLWPW